MKRVKNFENKLVNITIEQPNKNLSTISGWVTAVSKDYLILMDQDKRDHSFKRDKIKHIKRIENGKH